MPAHVKYFLIISAILEIGVGAFFFLAPEVAVAKAFVGIGASESATYAMRLAGSALFSLGLMALMARNMTSAVALRPVLVALLAYNVLAVVQFLPLGLSLVPDALAPAILHLLLGIASVYYLMQKD
ncbi:MAG: hypothetical protein GC184_12455 [Rhizobiales bacterium]|nr:hypothetical protein [Hyphomicrobiales bacterium]